MDQDTLFIVTYRDGSQTDPHTLEEIADFDDLIDILRIDSYSKESDRDELTCLEELKHD